MPDWWLCVELKEMLAGVCSNGGGSHGAKQVEEPGRTETTQGGATGLNIGSPRQWYEDQEATHF